MYVMAKPVIARIYIPYLYYILQPVRTGIIHTSKACYGSGTRCVQHDINCSSTQKIAIYDAYYTDNTECGPTGVSSCGTVNPENVTKGGYHRFNINEVVSLYKNCSRKHGCRYRANWRGAAKTFSVFKYQCIDRTGSGSTANCMSSTKYITSQGQRRSNTGAIAGGVVATVVAVLVVKLVSVWIIQRRRKNSQVKEKDANPNTTYGLAGNLPQNYHEIQTLRTENGDYNYATANGMVLPPTTNTYFIIEPAGKHTAGGNSKTAEGDYDHLGNKPSPQTSDYDTTASVVQPGYIGEGGYGFNHFRKEVNPQTHQNDYDTAASATKAVAKISTTERNTDEDDYDHFQRGTNASETVSSPYDTTSGINDNPGYSVAGQMK